MAEDLDPRAFTLEEWLGRHGTRTGTFTYNDVAYDEMNEVDWRQANRWRPTADKSD